MTDSVAVVGTGTGVGKTVVTAGLTGWLRDAGVDARGVKPVQTGYPPDDDVAFVVAVCGGGDAAHCCRRLEPPLAPRVAAERTDADLAYADVLADCEAALDAADVGVLEGIGGLRVPLAGDREVVDLVADLSLPAVVVARPDLGTLNHTALTVKALDRRDVSVTGIVLNEYRGASVAERTNPDELRRILDTPVHTLPPVATDDPPSVAADVRTALPETVFPAPIRERAFH